VRTVTWNARIPYRALPLTSVAKEIARLRRRWDDNITIDLREMSKVVWTGLIYLLIGTSGGLL
jgi:hypothetical protein